MLCTDVKRINYADMVSSENGLRHELASFLAEVNFAILRFPGGNNM